jgi:hypothetical protein
MASSHFVLQQVLPVFSWRLTARLSSILMKGLIDKLSAGRAAIQMEKEIQFLFKSQSISQEEFHLLCVATFF